MRYTSKAYTYFSISGKNFDTQDFVNLIQITPTKVGENRLGEKFWEYKIEATDSDQDLDKAIEKLIQIFNPKSNEIQAYASQKGLYIKIFVVIQSKNNEDNGVFLNRNFIKFLGDMGAEIEIDIYN
ncbi:DUF4279 domain-containing protein [Aquiflexum sp.]|uniref:DUF4279 domain-containing protein n=1 Tax=Aquiflexum sp. TaxID=1872584 RepID=UPI0035939C90